VTEQRRALSVAVAVERVNPVKPTLEELARDPAMTDAQWIEELHPDLRPYVYYPPVFDCIGISHPLEHDPGEIVAR
jgi:hypothetical protein